MAQSQKSYSVHLDAIRGIAAFVVFAGHARVLFINSMLGSAGIGANAVSPNGTSVVHRTGVTTPGHEAVIVFFVLSGFLVGGSALRAWLRNAWSWKEYSLQRMTRLWTVLIPALVIGAILDNLGIALFGTGGIYGAPAGQDMVFPDFAARRLFTTFLGNLFFVQGILVEPFGSNSPLWTLSYEFWFYFSFPILLVAFSAQFPKLKRVLALAGLMGIGFFVGTKISMYFLFWIAGAIIELIPRRIPLIVAHRLVPVFAIGFILVCFALLKFLPPILLSDTIEGLAFCVLCYILLHETQDAEKNLYCISARFLSNMSYTIYLTHAPILAFLSAAIMGNWSLWPLDLTHLLKFISIVSLAFMCSYLIYWCFERNTYLVRKWFRSILLNKNVLAKTEMTQSK